MKKLGIIKSLYVGFSLLISLMLAITVFAVIQISAIDASLSNINDNLAIKQRLAINLRGAVHDSSIALRDVLLAPNPDQRKIHIDTLSKLNQDYERTQGQLDQIFASASADHTEYEQELSSQEQVVSLASHLRVSAAKQELVLTTAALYEEWLQDINSFIEYQEVTAQRSVTAVGEATAQLLYILMGATLISLIVGVVVGLGIIDKIKRIIGGSPEKTIKVINQFARGDLTVRIKTKYPDSIADDINKMAEQLSSVMRKVRDVTANLSQSSETLSDFTSNNNTLSQHQQEETQRGGTNIETLMAGVSNVAALADSARSSTDLAQKESQNGNA